MKIVLCSPKQGEEISLLSRGHRVLLSGGVSVQADDGLDWENLKRKGTENSYPQPVRFVWSIGEADTAKLRQIKLLLSTEPDFARSRVIACPADSREAEVYNLRAGRRYFWKVQALGSGERDESPEGSFCTRDEAPTLYKVEELTNIRDIGGWHTADGRRVRRDMVFRGSEMDTHHQLTEAGRRSMREELRQFVHSIQPDCVINGRIGYGLGDYRQMGDNEIPVLAYRGAWETPMTLNNTWGYSKTDERWKSPKTVMKMLIDVASKGGNLLINVGPDELGRIPQGSADVLSRVGGWLKKNGESIYGTKPCADSPYQLRWGGLTGRGSTVYLHILDAGETPARIKICNIETWAKRAYLLSTGEELPIIQTYELARDEYRFVVEYPEDRLDELDTVIAAEFEQPPVFHSLYMTFDRNESGLETGID